jgi:dolichyl-phosphate beta-glucosyltransferase
MTMSPNVLLIIPCYNEVRRLNFHVFNKYRNQIDFLFADDGSTDDTAQLIRDNNYEVYQSSSNVGKSHIIYQAFWSLKKANRVSNYEWIGYWDADLTIPLTTIADMMKYLDFYPSQEVVAIWSSRNCRLGSRSRDKFIRHILGRTFARLVNIFLGIHAYDTQCGAKIFRPEAAQIAFKEKFISKWIFDIEILLRLKNKPVIEFPLITWLDMEGSKVKPIKEIPNVIWDLLLIKLKYKFSKGQK